MRHCMVVHARYPIGETRVEREASALIGRGHEVDVICLQQEGTPAQEVVDGVNVYRMPVHRQHGSGVFIQFLEYMTFFILASIKVVAQHLKRHYNVVQAHNLPDWLVFVGLVPKLTGARVILDLHDLMPEFFVSRFNRGFNSWPVKLLIWQEKVSCWFADHVITVTEAWRQTLIERGVPLSKASVVMNVADDRFFYRPVDFIPSKRNHSFQLIYHGNVNHRSGVDIAVRAIALVKNQIPSIRLLVHGRGDAFDSVVDLAKELGLENHISFSSKGMLTPELVQLILQADIGLVPYRADLFADAVLPTKLMEYSALGIPSIAARTSAIQAYFNDSMVEFFEPGNVDDLARCIRALYNNPDRMSELAVGIREFNQQYNWTKLGSEYADLIEHLAEKGKSPVTGAKTLASNSKNITK